jgi:tRNA(fMet)-specific endonuclease VapC
VYCFDTDVLSATMRREPDLALVRRLAQLPPSEQFTTAITLGELLYGAERRGSDRLRARVRDLVRGALTVLPFDELAAETYGPLRAQLESEGRRLDEPDLRIASIALAADLTLVTANVRHFDRVPGLTIENWLADDEGRS